MTPAAGKRGVTPRGAARLSLRLSRTATPRGGAALSPWPERTGGPGGPYKLPGKAVQREAPRSPRPQGCRPLTQLPVLCPDPKAPATAPRYRGAEPFPSPGAVSLGRGQLARSPRREREPLGTPRGAPRPLWPQARPSLLRQFGHAGDKCFPTEVGKRDFASQGPAVSAVGAAPRSVCTRGPHPSQPPPQGARRLRSFGRLRLQAALADSASDPAPPNPSFWLSPLK